MSCDRGEDPSCGSPSTWGSRRSWELDIFKEIKCVAEAGAKREGGSRD